MKSMILKNGAKTIAEILAGGDKKLNGMYVEYSSKIPSKVQEKDAKYFETLLKSGASGYARVPVQHAYVDDNNNINFTALVSADDFKGGALSPDSRIVAITLVVLDKNNVVDDVLVYSALVPRPVVIAEGTTMSVHTSLTLGAN